MIDNSEDKSSFKLNENDISTIKFNQSMKNLKFVITVALEGILKYDLKSITDADA